MQVGHFMMVITLCGIVMASPTRNEFEACDRLSVKMFEKCLEEASPTIEDTCWEKSKAAYRRCTNEVYALHTPYKSAIADELEREIEAQE